MQPNDPTFGAGFNADEFRSKIKSTMQMGAPNEEVDRVTFYWKHSATFPVADAAGKPFDFTSQTSSSTRKDPVQVDCAVKFTSRISTSEETPLGSIDSPRIVITLLDEDYELAKGADWVTVRGDRYDISYTEPIIGLFDVDVYKVHATAQDLGSN